MSILRTTSASDLPAGARRRIEFASRSQPKPFQTKAKRALAHAAPNEPDTEELQEEFVWTFPKAAEKASSGTPWNKGRSIGAKLALKPRHVWSLRFHLQREGMIRDLSMFDLAIDTKLRGCDLVKLRIGDVVADGEPKKRATVVQQKTGKPVTFELTEQTRDSLVGWLNVRSGCLEDFVFPSNQTADAHIGTRQYARLVKRWM